MTAWCLSYATGGGLQAGQPMVAWNGAPAPPARGSLTINGPSLVDMFMAEGATSMTINYAASGGTSGTSTTTRSAAHLVR